MKIVHCFPDGCDCCSSSLVEFEIETLKGLPFLQPKKPEKVEVTEQTNWP